MTVRYLFPQDYMADPAAHVFGGRLFIYPSHDRDTGIPEQDDGSHFDMVDYHVLEITGSGAPDPMTGKVVDRGVILRLEDVPWATRQLWDSDVAEKDGRYYLYFSARGKDGDFHIGVATADSPEGPFEARPEPVKGSYSIDPCVFRDADGTHYIVFGGLWGGQLQRYRDNRAVYPAAADSLPRDNRSALEPNDAEPALCPKIARLSDDMLSFAEPPRDLVVTDENGAPLKAGDHARRFFEASWLCRRENGEYSFSYSTGDTHLICEATSANVYGPYRFSRVLLEPQVGWTTHHCLTKVGGRWYLFHHDSTPSGGRTWLRSLKVKPL